MSQLMGQTLCDQDVEALKQQIDVNYSIQLSLRSKLSLNYKGSKGCGGSNFETSANLECETQTQTGPRQLTTDPLADRSFRGPSIRRIAGSSSMARLKTLNCDTLCTIRTLCISNVAGFLPSVSLDSLEKPWHLYTAHDSTMFESKEGFVGETPRFQLFKGV